MALPLTNNTKSLIRQISKTPSIVLEIEGSLYLYGNVDIQETIKWDDPRVTWDNTNGYVWDGLIPKINSKPYIDLNRSSVDFSQQLFVDKGGSGSVSSLRLALVDYRGEVARDIAFNRMGEIIGKKATIYMGLSGTIFPQDFNELFVANIDEVTYEAGMVLLTVSHAENTKRQFILEQYVNELTFDIDASTTTIPVEAVEPFIESQDALTSYIRVGDEIMLVTAKNANDFTVVRAQLGTTAANASVEDEVTSYYSLKGRPIDLALKIMLSNGGVNQSFGTIESINFINVSTEIPNAIVVDNEDIERFSGLTANDSVIIPAPSLNAGTYTVQSFGILNTGKSYIIVDETLITEEIVNVPLEFRSKYNTLPLEAGLSMEPNQVDVLGMEDVQNIFVTEFVDYDFPIIETIENAKDFIDGEIMRSQGLYTINRKARTSCKYTAPPFTVTTLPNLNTSNLVKVGDIKMTRSASKYLKNTLIYRYNQSVLEDKSLKKYIRVSADSFNRIPVGRKRDEINARGLKNTPDVNQMLDRVSGKVIDRYKFAARYLENVKTTFEVGYPLELGDIVFLGGDDMQLVDINTGERNMPVAQYEIINKKQSLNSDVTLTLLETGFAIDAIFGVFSPSSPVLAGSSTTRIFLGRLWDTTQYNFERDKWADYIGTKIRVRSEDYLFDETVTLDRLDGSSENGIIVDPPLSSAPLAGYFVEIAKLPNYSDSDIDTTIVKKYTQTMPFTDITAVTDAQIFDVNNISDFEVGMEVQVHSDDYVRDSETRIIDDITGDTITLSSALDILPVVGDLMETYSFAETRGYRFL